MTEHRRPKPPFPWWYAPASAAITGGAVAIPALGFPLNIATAIGVAAGAGVYLGYHQRRTDLPQGRRRVVGLAFVALFLVLMALSVVVSVAELPGVVAATLVFTGFVVGFFYPSAWNAAG